MYIESLKGSHTPIPLDGAVRFGTEAGAWFTKMPPRARNYCSILTANVGIQNDR